jgi:DNA-binding response OmpR family regulator
MPAGLLIVDDEVVLTTVLADFFVSEGFAVRTAHNGATALAAHTHAPATVILSDIMMPIMDGYTLVQELRSRGDLTPVVLMSAAGHFDGRSRHVQFLRKPFDLDEALAVVHWGLDQSPT